MRGSHDKDFPVEYLDWIGLANENWNPSYPFDSRMVRDAVINSLFHAQRGLCVYCGRLLDLTHPGKTFHIEHFRPQSRYKADAVKLDNLFLSCGQDDKTGARSQTCGTKKDEWFNDLCHIAPIYPDCVSHFHFTLNGEVVAATGSTAADLMIGELNLNHKELVKDREQLLYLIDDGALDSGDFYSPITGLAASYAHVAFKHLGDIIP